MTISSDIDALTARFISRWAAMPTTSAIPVAYDNAPNETRSGTWARFVVRPGASERNSYTIGTTRVRQLGRVVISIFVPRGSGTGSASAIADAAASIFRLWKSPDTDLRSFDPEISTVPASANDEFYQVNVSVLFESEHIV